MPIDTKKIALFHGSVWLLILTLGLGAFRFKSSTYDLNLKYHVAKTANTTIENLQAAVRQSLEITRVYAHEYAHKENITCLNRAIQINQYADSLFNLPVYYSMCNDLSLFLKLDTARTYDLAQILTKYASLSPIDPQLIRIQFLLMELTALKYYENQVFPQIECGGDPDEGPRLNITDFGRSPNEPILGDILFKIETPEDFSEVNILLDDQLLIMDDGMAHFERRFIKPGIYPLKASISARKMHSDSLCTWEKTFYLKVQE